MKPLSSFDHVTRLQAVLLAGVAMLALPHGATAATKDSNTRTTRPAVSRTATPRPVTGGAVQTKGTARAVDAGIVVGIDRATGRLAAPTPDQMAKLARAKGALPGRSAQRPAPVFHADGSVSLDVRSWMREHTVVRIGHDGRVVTSCLDNRAAADGAAKHAPATSPAPEER